MLNFQIPELFVNYFDNKMRITPVNIAVTRVVLGTYFLWKGLSIDAAALTEWPVVRNDFYMYLYPPEPFGSIVVVERYVLVLSSIAFLVGYRTKVAAFLMALTMTHLAGLKMLYLFTIGETQQMVIASLLVMLFGLYAEQDRISVDEYRRIRRDSISDPSAIEGPYPMTALKWSLVTMGVLYFSAVWGRLVGGSLLEWLAPGSLSRWTLIFQEYFNRELFVGQWLIQSDLMLLASTVTTTIVEVGFLIAILAGMSLTPFFVVLLGFHAIVAIATGIFFFDAFFFLMLFFAYDRMLGFIWSSESSHVIYNPTATLAVTIATLAAHLDDNQEHDFTAVSDTKIAHDGGLAARIDGQTVEGFDAVQRLFSSIPYLVPVGWLLTLPVVSTVGRICFDRVSQIDSPGNSAENQL